MRKPRSDSVVRVASVPGAHPYVSGLGLARAGGRVLADPPVPGAPPGRWWPPRMLDPEWIAAHRERFDVMHVHFGVESLSTARLAAALDALGDARRPLVHTVHDLTHPQLHRQDRHLAQLELLVAAADGLITLTAGAAVEIERRFGRRATVIAHPAMRARAPLPAVGAGPAAVGVHLRDLRPGIDGPGTVALLAAALTRLPGVRGRVWMRSDVRDQAAAERVADACARSPQLRLIRAGRPGDAELEAELAGLAVSLLPYRHGTHSGWVELCVDLGVPVVAPAVGHIAGQHPEPGAVTGFTPGDARDLESALRAALSLPHAVAGSVARAERAAAQAARRDRERPLLAAAHLAIYRAAIG